MGLSFNYIFEYFQLYDYNSPVSFLIVLFGILLLFKQWRILLTLVMTISIAWYCHDWIIVNIRTLQEIASLSILIYIVGGTLTVLTAGLTFLKFMLH